MKLTFHLKMMSIDGIVIEDQVNSVYVTGTDGEYELLPFHYPLMGALPEGEIKISGYDPFPVKVGIIMFNHNQCKIIVESPSKQLQKTWSEVATKKEVPKAKGKVKK
jgi:F0F1-type ATP synthase epsilon subunit